MSEMPDGCSVDLDGEKVVVNFPVVGDYGHRVLSRHKPAYCERSSAGSGDVDASAPSAAQFAVKQVVGSTKTITLADQLHLSRFANIIGCYRRRRRRRGRAEEVCGYLLSILFGDPSTCTSTTAVRWR